jgi:hypothetical protein
MELQSPLFLILASAICVAACCTCLYVVLTRSARESRLIAQVEALEMSREHAKLEITGIAERCHEILDRTESKRRRFAAQEARQNAGGEEGDEPPVTALQDRPAVIRAVRARLRARGIQA